MVDDHASSARAGSSGAMTTGNPFIDAFVAVNPVFLVLGMFVVYRFAIYMLDLNPRPGAKPEVELKCPKKCPSPSNSAKEE